MDNPCESRIPRARLREFLLGRRAQIDGETRSRLDLALARNLLEVPAVQAARVLAVYWPIRGEPDLRGLAAGWRAAGKTVALPVMRGRALPLSFCAWEDDGGLEKGPFGIPVPTDRTPLTPDCLVIPCLGFSLGAGGPWRLGYGAGYYDRTLSSRPVAAVGVAYDEAESDQFAPHAMDAPLSLLVTPSRIINSIASP